jgi:hypothetical protein
MTRVLGAWGLVLLVAATALFAFDRVDTETYALMFGTAGAALTCSLVLWLTRPREIEAVGAVRFVPDLSLSSALLGIALFLLAVSVVVGFWLTLMGAALALWSLGGLLREWRAMRREARG